MRMCLRLLILVSLINGIIQHQCQAEEMLASEVIDIQECTINLIDKVTLAVDKPGIIGKVVVKEGDLVLAKSLVVQLKNEEAQAQVNLAIKAKEVTAEVDIAKKNNEVANKELERAVKINQSSKAITEHELNRLQLAVDQTNLEIEKAEDERTLKALEYTVAMARLKAHDVDSTISGVVVRIYKSAGEAVQQGDPLCEIVNDERLRIEGYVPVSLLHKLTRGQKVTVAMKINSEQTQVEAEGVLDFIDIVVQPVTREVRVFAEVKNLDHKLKPGLRASMKIHVGEQAVSVR